MKNPRDTNDFKGLTRTVGMKPTVCAIQKLGVKIWNLSINQFY